MSDAGIPLEIELRAYAEGPPRRGEPHKLARKELLNPSRWTLVFDTETLTDAGQALRFGSYQVRSGEDLHEAGLFYAPELTTGELELLSRFSAEHGLRLLTRAEFIVQVFYRYGYDRRGSIVGFNLPWDLSRLALAHGLARGSMYGGFSLKLALDRRLPPVRLKHLSRRASLIQFGTPWRQRTPKNMRARGELMPERRGYFVDVRTLAAALFSRGFSLDGLGEFLNVEHRKLQTEEHGAKLTDSYIRYAVQDAASTWACFAELMRRYRALGLHDTPAHRIYSEASIGKAYLRAMGVKPWREVQPDFPPRLLGIIMSTYFGGRSEVRIRRELREVVLCDFLSMYPTVCTLMRLWSFVIAQGMTWRDATDGTRALLGRVTLDDLQRQETWSRLATLVRVMPDGDLFPIRARYEEGGQATIGLNSAKSTKALWFTLADCIASRLLTGRTPQILEAIAFEAGEPQTGLEPVNVSGKAAYRVDPTRDDLFKRTIELRHEVKVRAANSAGGERDALESEQLALKILANATSYGGFVEVNVQEKAKAQAVTVHCGGDAPYVSLTSNLEVPGRYFHPLLATLITGAARLKLAITERLASDRGLEWAFCDTDSMALAKPPTMQRDVFNERVSAVVEWFTPLNPYEFSGPILKVEGVNFDIVSREREPLFSWAVSAKRYALFNVTPDGTPVLRKASAHGLGHLRAPYDDSNPAPGLPRPAVSLAELGVELWQHDLWFAIVSAAVSGGPNSVNLSYHPALSQPAVSQYSATTPALLQWFQRYNRGRPYSDQVKPLGFLFSLFATRFDPASSRPRRGIARPVATFDRDHQAACRNAFDRETGEAIGEASLKSYHQLLAQYHLQPEAKFLNGDYLDRGTTVRRLVEITGVNHIGKEANRWEEQEHLGLDDDAAVTYGSGGQEFESLRRPLRELSNEIGQREIAAALGCSRSRIAMLLGSSPIRLARREVERLRSAVARLFEEQAQRRAEHERNRRFVQAIATESGLAVAAAAIAVDPSNLAKVLSGKRRMSAAASERLRELTANGVGRRSN